MTGDEKRLAALATGTGLLIAAVTLYAVFPAELPAAGSAPVPAAAPAPAFLARAPAAASILRYPPPVSAAAAAASDGIYVPRGFPSDFRARLVTDFGRLVDERLGPGFPPDRRAALAAVQERFWDEHGPDVDAFRSGSIDRRDFADRTHREMDELAASFAGILTPSEYQALLDAPPGVDPYPLLFHSPGEQPGLPFHADASEPLPAHGGAPSPGAVLPQPAPGAGKTLPVPVIPPKPR